MRNKRCDSLVYGAEGFHLSRGDLSRAKVALKLFSSAWNRLLFGRTFRQCIGSASRRNALAGVLDEQCPASKKKSALRKAEAL